MMSLASSTNRLRVGVDDWALAVPAGRGVAVGECVQGDARRLGPLWGGVTIVPLRTISPVELRGRRVVLAADAFVELVADLADDAGGCPAGHEVLAGPPGREVVGRGRNLQPVSTTWRIASTISRRGSIHPCHPTALH